MFYLIDKEKGITSFRAIRNFAKKNNIKKIGHTGTLDPLATGLLLVATEEDTKLIDYVDKGFKEYRATMILGLKSDTYDIEGKVEKINKQLPTFEQVKKELNNFLGKVEQVPPNFSAKKINGIRAYELARQGKEIKLKSSIVNIKSIRNLVQLSENKYQFDVEVSRGTYIRSLIHDLGNKLGCGAIMSDLDRIKIGNLTKRDINTNINISKIFILDIVKIEKITDLLNGKIIQYQNKNGKFGLSYKDNIVGIVEIKENQMKPLKLIGKKIERLYESK